MLYAAAAAAVTSAAPMPKETKYSRPVTLRLAYFSGTCSQRCGITQDYEVSEPCVTAVGSPVTLLAARVPCFPLACKGCGLAACGQHHKW
jgi:hypothetical protein